MQNETVAKDMLEWYGTDPEGPTPLEEHGYVEHIVNPLPGELFEEFTQQINPLAKSLV